MLSFIAIAFACLSVVAGIVFMLVSTRRMRDLGGRPGPATPAQKRFCILFIAATVALVGGYLGVLFYLPLEYRWIAGIAYGPLLTALLYFGIKHGKRYETLDQNH